MLVFMIMVSVEASAKVFFSKCSITLNPFTPRLLHTAGLWGGKISYILLSYIGGYK